MKFLARFAAGLVILILVLVAGAYLTPRDVAVSRSTRIAAPPEAVFAHLDNLQAFAEWSPWAELDPDMEQRFEGPERGVGNRMVWSSEDPSVGNGTQEIVAVEDNARVATALDFGPMGLADAEWRLVPEGDGTEVTWSFTSDMGLNPIARYIGLMMDRWVGGDYEKGLARLKARVESEG